MSNWAEAWEKISDRFLNLEVFYKTSLYFNFNSSIIKTACQKISGFIMLGWSSCAVTMVTHYFCFWQVRKWAMLNSWDPNTELDQSRIWPNLLGPVIRNRSEPTQVLGIGLVQKHATFSLLQNRSESWPGLRVGAPPHSILLSGCRTNPTSASWPWSTSPCSEGRRGKTHGPRRCHHSPELWPGQEGNISSDLFTCFQKEINKGKEKKGRKNERLNGRMERRKGSRKIKRKKWKDEG